ncbi:MAG: DUF4302 domain-containing protein [Prevotella sp.]|nr:DUF4302 domain-containing protein [Prevotella sp.]
MNKKHIFFIMMALPLLFSSCLKDQDDVFDKSPSARSAEYLANVKRVLTSAENGWVLNYYPDRDQSYGGFAYTLKFDDENVKVCCGDLAIDSVSESITSTYILDNEDGPVLSFDTYNEMMHYFATPTGSSGAGGYEAYDGDFIFIVLGISSDENTITLKGNRSGNIMYMHKLTMSMEDYQRKVADFVDQLVFDKAAGKIGGEEDTLYIYSNYRYVEIQTPDTLIEAAICFEDNGFSLYEPVSISGTEVKTFVYNSELATFTAKEDASVVFTGLLVPSIVINNVGSAITTGNNAADFTYTYNLADKFNYQSDADWITVSVEGNTLSIHVAENTTGAARAGHIIVTADGDPAVITISQLEVDALVGSYGMRAIDSENQWFTANAVVAPIDGAENFYTLKFAYLGYPQTIVLEWNPVEYRFELQSGQSIGTLGRYYSFLALIDADFNYWTGTSTGATGWLVPSLTDAGVVLRPAGYFGSNEVGGFAILVGTDPAIENMLGYYDAFLNITFTKK